MAGAGARLFPENSKLTSAQVNTYLMDQTIMRFATTSARDAAFGGVGEPTLAEGMTCYIDADNSIYIYDGSNWVKMVSASNPPALTLVAQGSFTSISSASPLELTNVLTTEFPHYRLIMSWTQSSAGGWLNMRLRNSGGVISTSTYDNQGVEHYASTLGASGALGSAAWNQLAYNYNLGFYSYFTCDITYATVNQPTFMQGRGGTKRTGGGGAYMYVRDTHGYHDQSTIATGLNLYPDGGAMTGFFSLYGYR